MSSKSRWISIGLVLIVDCKFTQKSECNAHVTLSLYNNQIPHFTFKTVFLSYTILLDDVIFIQKNEVILFSISPATSTPETTSSAPETSSSAPEATSSQRSAIIIGTSLGGSLLLVIVLLVMVIIIAVVVVQKKKAAVHSFQVDVPAR